MLTIMFTWSPLPQFNFNFNYLKTNLKNIFFQINWLNLKFETWNKKIYFTRSTLNVKIKQLDMFFKSKFGIFSLKVKIYSSMEVNKSNLEHFFTFYDTCGRIIYLLIEQWEEGARKMKFS